MALVALSERGKGRPAHINASGVCWAACEAGQPVLLMLSSGSTVEVEVEAGGGHGPVVEALRKAGAVLVAFPYGDDGASDYVNPALVLRAQDDNRQGFTMLDFGPGRWLTVHCPLDDVLARLAG